MVIYVKGVVLKDLYVNSRSFFITGSDTVRATKLFHALYLSTHPHGITVTLREKTSILGPGNSSEAVFPKDEMEELGYEPQWGTKVEYRRDRDIYEALVDLAIVEWDSSVPYTANSFVPSFLTVMEIEGYRAFVADKAFMSREIPGSIAVTGVRWSWLISPLRYARKYGPSMAVRAARQDLEIAIRRASQEEGGALFLEYPELLWHDDLLRAIGERRLKTVVLTGSIEVIVGLLDVQKDVSLISLTPEWGRVFNARELMRWLGPLGLDPRDPESGEFPTRVKPVPKPHAKEV